MAYRKKHRKSDDNRARIAIVDDHPIVRQGLAEIIDNESDLITCAQAEDAPQAMEAIKTHKPDMAIVDISLKQTSGLELIKDLKVCFPNLPVLTVSMHEEALYAERALRAGARGYIMKGEDTKSMIEAIRKVLNDQLYVSSKVSEKMMKRLINGRSDMVESPIDCLSDRELEVLLLIGQGYGTRQIAEKLFLSIKTIETYRSHIKEKLGLEGAAKLLQYAIQWVNNNGGY